MNHDPRLYFLALAEERDLKRAALRWGVTQRLIRISIARLERDYGTALCVIEAKKASLTEAGKRLQRSLCCVDVDDDIFRRIGVIEDTQSEHGISDWMLRAAYNAWPFINIELSRGNLKEQVARIDSGATDIAMLYGWPTVDFSKLTYRKLYDQDMVAFLAQEPATEPGPIALASLRQKTWIVPSPTIVPGIEDLLSWECRKEGFCPRRSSVRLKSHFLEAIRYERAVGFAPANFLAVLPPEIATVPLVKRVTIPFGCLHRTHEPSTSVHRLINLMCRLTSLPEEAPQPPFRPHERAAHSEACEKEADQPAYVAV